MAPARGPFSTARRPTRSRSVRDTTPTSTPAGSVTATAEMFHRSSLRAMKARVVEEPHVNPGPQHREMWLRDPDGYVVVIVSPDGEAH